MQNNPMGSITLRAVVAVAAIAVALAAFSGSLATRTESAPQTPVAQVQSGPHEDPSLKGLRVAPDADPGGDYETF